MRCWQRRPRTRITLCALLVVSSAVLGTEEAVVMVIMNLVNFLVIVNQFLSLLLNIFSLPPFVV